MAKKEYLPFNEYLSVTGNTSIISKISTLIGKCYMQCNGRSWRSMYFTPAYLVEELDKDGNLRVNLIEKKVISKREEVYDPPYGQDRAEFTTFQYILTNKIKKYKVSVDKTTGIIKVGTARMYSNSLKEYDLSKPDELKTYEIYPD